MKKVALMQPYLFPYLGYFQLIQAVDEYIIYDDVQYIVGGWINRNNVLINGEKKLFTFSVAKASPHKQINELIIADNFEKFYKMIGNAYAKAPHKDSVIELLKKITSFEDHNLARFTGNSIIEIARYLKNTTPIIYSSSIPKNQQLTGQSKVVEICQKRQASQYINAIGGQGLYDKQVFADHKLQLKFIKPHLPHYKQLKNNFVSGLSIIDVMMFNTPEEIGSMLEDYELI